MFIIRSIEREFPVMLNLEPSAVLRRTANRFPNGGVAPLRRELALHDHIERQSRFERSIRIIDSPLISRTVFRDVIAFTTNLVRPIVAIWLGKTGSHVD
jgi:hypothetical protein